MARVPSLLLCCLLALPLMFLSCGDTEDGPVQVGTMKEYHISCDAGALDSLLLNFRSNRYIPITIHYAGRTVTGRMRIRGDTSREDPKKSFKIDLDSTLSEDVPTTLNLNAEYADRTYARQFLSTLMMHRAGQICYRTEHVQLFINDAFTGLYLQVENMDTDFLTRNGLPTDGNLYKATKDGACLSIHDDFEADWEKKTNRRSDHNDLEQLIRDINTVPDHAFEAFLNRTFHYEELVNIMALNMLLSNASTYYHNYYLYHDLYEDGKWRLLPWDMDKSMSYYNWMPYTYHRTSSEWESDNALIERALLCGPVFADVQQRVDDLARSTLNDAAIARTIDSLLILLEDPVGRDTVDQLGSTTQWKEALGRERSYFSEHHERLTDQFKNAPRSFAVLNSGSVQTGPTTFQWRRSHHPSDKAISYTLTYGPDILLKDSSTTVKVGNIADTTYIVDPPLPEGTYYWKVTATDGEHRTDGFNTRNILRVKKGTPLPSEISGRLRLTKAGSPYVAEQLTQVHEGAAFIIEKGVEVHMPNDGVISCSGIFRAHGTATEPIIFRPRNDATSWGHIFFYAGCPKASLKNVIIEEGVLNSKTRELELDSCTMHVQQKDIGQISGNRVDLIYADNGKLSIRNSTFLSNGHGEGMVLFDSEVITENCYFNRVPDAIEYIGCKRGIIRNNYVVNSPDDAVDLNNCSNVLIEGNFLFYNKDKAISIGTEQYGPSQENILIRRNLLLRNHFGIAVKDSSIARVENNTIVGNTYGINAYRKREDYVQGGTVFVSNTIFHDNEKTNAYPDEYSMMEVSHSLLSRSLLAGDQNLQADPGFINPSRDIFHLRSSSPCIGAGSDRTDMGVFQQNEPVLAFAEVHVRSSDARPCGDHIKLVNNYNYPMDLSLFGILIENGNEKRQFVFPIGSEMERMGALYICRDHERLMSCYTNAHAIGGLPALKPVPTTISLTDPTGYVLDTFSYEVPSTGERAITFKASETANTAVRTWQMYTDQ